MAYFKKIEGINVFLSPIDVEKDYLTYMEWCNRDDDDSYFVFDKYINGNISKEQAYDKMKQYEQENSFAIIDKSNNKFIGLIGLSNTLQNNQRSNIWIKIDTSIDLEAQITKGSESLNLMLKYCFDYLNLYSIVLEYPAVTKQTRGICEKSKMRYIATKSEAVLLKEDVFDNTILYECNPPLYKKIIPIGDESKKTYDLNSQKKRINLNNTDKTREIIIGKKIRLVKPSSIDIKKEANEVAKYMSNPKIAIPLGEFKTNWTIESAKKYLEHVDYVIMLNDDTNKLIGSIMLFNKNNRNRTANIETVIGYPELHNQGFGTEAKDLFLEEIYANGIYNNLLSSVFDFNNLSRGVNEHIGFNYIGIREGAYYAYGHLNNMKLYEMTRNLYNQEKNKKRIDKKLLEKKKV